MANLSQPVRIAPQTSGSVVNGHCEQYSVGSFMYTGETGSTQVHIKTNVPRSPSGPMVMIEAIGYNYGAQQAIRCSWCFYVWTNNIIATGVNTCYPGLVPTGFYFSADNYVCLRGQISTEYYLGFTLNAYTTNAAVTTNITILATAVNANTGNHF